MWDSLRSTIRLAVFCSLQLLAGRVFKVAVGGFHTFTWLHTNGRHNQTKKNGGKSFLLLTSSQFMEKIFIKRLVLVFGSCGEEDVAANEFMDNFAVAAQTAECYRDVLVKLYCHLETEAAN